MNSKTLMIASALFLGICGVLFQFLPHEVLAYEEIAVAGITPLFVQVIGALYLGFAVTNWMAKTILIGGIYARPLAMGNFAHFVIGALALLKFALGVQHLMTVWIAAIIYTIFAILFAIVLFTSPLKPND